MLQDKICLILKEIAQHRNKIKDIKKDIKAAEKIDEEEFKQLEAALKDLKKQVKTYKENFLQELSEDSHYNKLRELKLEEEEDLAEKSGNLFSLLDQLPSKPHEMKIETEEGFTNINIQPEMKLYLNGKEERRRNF